MPQTELGAFLRNRRGAVAPGDVGLPDTERRRVPGLRREEVAMLVGLSTDYYVRLEQGRGGHPSASVVDAIARTLQLSRAEHAHLRDLAAEGSRAVRPRRPPIPKAGEGVHRLLDQMDVPALVMTRCTQVVGWNPLGERLIHPFSEIEPEARNMARLFFHDPEMAARHRDWDTSARDLVGILRMTAGREPHNIRLQELVGELAVSSEVFRRLWADHHVHEKAGGPKPVRHPEVGEMDLRYETLLVACDTDLMVVTYTAEPGSESAERLGLLRSLVASEAAERAAAVVA